MVLKIQKNEELIQCWISSSHFLDSSDSALHLKITLMKCRIVYVFLFSSFENGTFHAPTLEYFFVCRIIRLVGQQTERSTQSRPRAQLYFSDETSASNYVLRHL